MKNLIIFILVSLWLCSCTKDEPNTPGDLSPGLNWIKVKSSSYAIPFNGIGLARLSAYTDAGSELTSSATFYVNGQKLDQNIWKPNALGNYSVTASFLDLKSMPVEIRVEPPLNKKVLIESFTSRTCGFCPWIGTRLDSLDQANKNVISYSIHGQDELEASETYALQELLSVYGRPSVRINRGYVRNFDAPVEIQELLDSVQYFLSSQPKMELSIQTTVQGQSITADVFGKYYEAIQDEIYLTLVMVEDSVITHDQYNYFNGYSWDYCPYASLPIYLPDYNNHNVLRKVLSDPKGDLINKVSFEKGITQQIGSFTFSFDPNIDLSKSSLIAIVHRQQNGIEVSTVLNSQIVKVGQHVGFNE